MFSASLQENVAIFKGKDYRDSLRSCIGIMLLDSILESGTPYQAECGVSKVVYLSQGPSTTFLPVNEMRLHTFVMWTSWQEPPGKRRSKCSII